jgi:hypothetical protein
MVYNGFHLPNADAAALGKTANKNIPCRKAFNRCFATEQSY